MDKDKVDYESCEFWALRDAISENEAIVVRISIQKEMLNVDISDSEKAILAEVEEYTRSIRRKKFDLSYSEIESETIKLEELYKKAKPIEKKLLEMLDNSKRD